jgi:hypothetical protein
MEKTFGPAWRTVANVIVKKLYRKLSLEFDGRFEYWLADLIHAARYAPQDLPTYKGELNARSGLAP